MNKKLSVYCIAMCLIAYSQLIYSDESLPDTVLTISLDVVNITCDINDGQGFNKIIDFETINESDLLTGKQPAVKAQFIVDCQKSGVKPDFIDIKMRPGSQGTLNNGHQFDISFFAKPYAQAQTVEKGLMKSSVIINALYK